MNKMTEQVLLVLAVGLLALHCKSKEAKDEGDPAAQSVIAPEADDRLMEEEEEMGGDYDDEAPAAAMAAEKSTFKKEMARDTRSKRRKPSGPGKDANKVGGKGGGGAAEQGPAPRAWFPETFLFNPLVVTDDQGDAQVDVRVPDRLTSWRVLALAHSRNGSQAGATTEFQGTLPAYVDPVVPSFLRVGDTVKIPIQLVNNTDASMSTSLKVEVEGATLIGETQALTIAKRSSSIRYVSLTATKPGEIRLMARMGDLDMVVRTIPAVPTGKPVDHSKNGTLAAPREFSIMGPNASGVSKGRARLAVFPGALALLRSELATSMHRGGMAADAFALLLAGRAPELLQSLGDEADPKALRKMTITATQKVMKHARVLDVTSATLIAEAARSHGQNPVLERLGMRAIQTIEAGQAPDGTCGAQNGWTLQRLLVATADCARAAHDAPNVTIRASGAFERHAKEIADPYTAAAILAANGAQGELRGALQKLVLDAIKSSENGAKYLELPPMVVRADGQSPSRVEATALAVLALGDLPDAPLADLGATILGSYSPRYGWGDGRANLVCMKAALALFKDPMPEQVTIVLRKDGEVVTEGVLDRAKVREVLNLGADGLDIGGEHAWSVSADPALPGLGFSLTLTSWVPWVSGDATTGAELLVELPGGMSVGKAVNVPLLASVPGGRDFEIDMALPAGAQVDRQSLDALVASSQIYRYKESDGKVKLFARRLSQGQRFAATVRVIPTLGGSLQSGPTTIRVGGIESHLAPERWVVR